MDSHLIISCILLHRMISTYCISEWVLCQKHLGLHKRKKGWEPLICSASQASTIAVSHELLVLIASRQIFNQNSNSYCFVRSDANCPDIFIFDHLLSSFCVILKSLFPFIPAVNSFHLPDNIKKISLIVSVPLTFPPLFILLPFTFLFNFPLSSSCVSASSDSEILLK